MLLAQPTRQPIQKKLQPNTVQATHEQSHPTQSPNHYKKIELLCFISVLTIGSALAYSLTSNSMPAPSLRGKDKSNIDLNKIQSKPQRPVEPIIEPPIQGSSYNINNLILEEDPSSYQGMTFLGQKNVIMEQYTGTEPLTGFKLAVIENVYQFKLHISNTHDITLNANPEFGSAEEAQKTGEKYARIIGQLPSYLHTCIKEINLHKHGDHKLSESSLRQSLLIYSDSFLQSLKDTPEAIEESLFSAVTWVSSELIHKDSTQYQQAIDTDGSYISTNARDDANSDFFETLPIAYLLKERPWRVPHSVREAAMKHIPNRLNYIEKHVMPNKHGYTHSYEGNKKPPYSGTVWISDKIITPEDPSTYCGLTYEGLEDTFMSQYRGHTPQSGWGMYFTRDTFHFKVEVSATHTINFNVNPDYGSQEAAEKDAAKYGKIIGQLPSALQNGIKQIYLHNNGNHSQSANGYAHYITIHAEQDRVHPTFSEEVMFHEAVHASLEIKTQRTRAYDLAMEKDGVGISTYAESRPDREDLTESLLPI